MRNGDFLMQKNDGSTRLSWNECLRATMHGCGARGTHRRCARCDLPLCLLHFSPLSLSPSPLYRIYIYTLCSLLSTICNLVCPSLVVSRTRSDAQGKRAMFIRVEATRPPAVGAKRQGHLIEACCVSKNEEFCIKNEESFI